MTLGLILAIVLILGSGIIWTIYPRRAFRKQMYQRDPRTFEEIYQAEFAHASVDYYAAVEFWRRLCGCLDVPPDRLRTTDRFAVELAPKKGWEYDDELGAVEHLIHEAARNRGIQVDLAHLHSVHDCVVALFATTEDAR